MTPEQDALPASDELAVVQAAVEEAFGRGDQFSEPLARQLLDHWAEAG